MHIFQIGSVYGLKVQIFVRKERSGGAAAFRFITWSKYWSLAETTYEDCLKHTEELSDILDQLPSPLLASDRSIDCMSIFQIFSTLADLVSQGCRYAYIVVSLALQACTCTRLIITYQASIIESFAFIVRIWREVTPMLSTQGRVRCLYRAPRILLLPSVSYYHAQISDHG